jgi:hypothetical protein
MYTVQSMNFITMNMLIYILMWMTDYKESNKLLGGGVDVCACGHLPPHR